MIMSTVLKLVLIHALIGHFGAAKETTEQIDDDSEAGKTKCILQNVTSNGSVTMCFFKHHILLRISIPL